MTTTTHILTQISRYWEQLCSKLQAPVHLMEVCGTHTVAINRFGLRSLLPEGLKLISGPGCPVCVTPVSHIDHVIAIAREPGAIIATFGDMMRVPGSRSSLQEAKAAGCDVRVVLSAFDTLKMAADNPNREVVFFGIGFETTSPTIAATMERAVKLGLKNFSVYPSFKLIPPAMRTLLEDHQAQIDGFICPGHVSIVIGLAPYQEIAAKYQTPCVISGFEADDILGSVMLLLEQLVEERSEAVNNYPRAVSEEGNPTAGRLLEECFQPCDANWRGIGVIPKSGLELSAAYDRFDARLRFVVPKPVEVDLPKGCACGEIMRGIKIPPQCPLFGKACTSANPVGPCMVSSEGACAAYYRYKQTSGS